MANISLLENEQDEDEEYAGMKPRDVCMRLSSFVDLIELYSDVNSVLIAENPKRYSSTFKEITQILQGLRNCLK